MTGARAAARLVLASAEGGCVRTPCHWGGSGLWRRGEIPVLDCSMVKLHFGCRGPSGIRVFLAYPPEVLLRGFLADGHLPCHRFQRQAGGVELQRSSFLLAEGGQVGGVIGGEDVGEAGGDPVPAGGDLSDRRAHPGGPPGFLTRTARPPPPRP